MESSLETKRIKTSDGTICNYITINGVNKMHCWESAAFLPEGSLRKAEYYLFGIKHTKDQWLEKKQDVNGVPWYKTSLGKAMGARV